MAAQEDILENELGEIQKVLLAMQVHILNLILVASIFVFEMEYIYIYIQEHE